MIRSLLTIGLATLLAGAAQAHFIFLVPHEEDRAKALMVFSETPEPGNPRLLPKIAHTRLFFRTNTGKVTPLTAKQTDDGFVVETLGDGPHTIGGVCEYGVLEKGPKPFLLNYYAKTVLGSPKSFKPCDPLKFDIVPTITTVAISFKVLYDGQPVVGAQAVVSRAGSDDETEHKTDDTGSFVVQGMAAGMLGVRVAHVEAISGNLAGKKYDEVRHYTTLTLDLTNATPSESERVVQDRPKRNLTEDSEATALLKDARSARAQWPSFPGFTADLTVNEDGKISKGQVQVDAQGYVTFVDLSPQIQAWAKSRVSSLVSHRTDGSAVLNTPCAFRDDVKDHPLGRAIVVLSDELHSHYRVRDRQITVVNREMGRMRFSITVLKNILNEEGQFLPETFVIHFWNSKSGKLIKTESHAQSWTRIGRYDLPESLKIIMDQKGLAARSLTFSNHKLLKVAAK